MNAVLEAGPPAPPGDEEGGGGWMWDRRYVEQPWPVEPDPVLVELVAALPPADAVDLGCGPG